MADPYWGALQKSVSDSELIEAAINRIAAAHNYFTTVSVWGMLPKSGADSSTVEDVINDLVSAHNDDPTAHLETGQSLQSHKASEIIDHIAGSIIEDKLANGCVTTDKITTNQIIGKDFETVANVGAGADGVKMTGSGIEMWQGGSKLVSIPTSGDPVFAGILHVKELQYLRHFWQTFFASSAGFSEAGTAAFGYGMGALNISTTNIANAFGSITGADLSGSLWLSTDGDLSLEFGLRLFLYSHGTVVFGFNMLNGVPDDSADYANGVSFEVVSNHLYAVVYGNDGVRHATQVLASVDNYSHVYRINYVHNTRIDWYIDGVIVYTQSAVLPTLANNTPFGFWMKTLTAANIYADLLYLTLEGPKVGN